MERVGRKSSGAVRFLIVAVIVLLLGCLGVLGYMLFRQPDGPEGPVNAQTLSQQQAVFPSGVSVSGTDIGGLTFDEAYERLQMVERDMLNDVEFILSDGNNSETFTAADMMATFNTSEVLTQAWMDAQRRKDEEQNDVLTVSNRDKFEIDYVLDVSGLRGELEEFAQEVYREPVDASVAIDLAYTGWFRYTEGVAGKTLDTDALYGTIALRAKEKRFGTVELPITYTDPEVTVEQLQRNLVKRSEAETSFAKKPYNRAERVYNVKRAAGLINGYVLHPDEVFSMNDTLGPRTYELGWKPAPAYVSGGAEDQAGGGVCQVSSTLYNAIVKADLEVVYRRAHSRTVGYVPRGLDATINTGTIDFKFKNNTSSDIYIFAYTVDKDDGPVPEGKSNQSVYIEIYGEQMPEEYDSIKITSELIETIKPSGEVEVIVDTSKPADYYEKTVERQNGYIYRSYKHYYKDGVEVRDPELLAESKYKAYNGTIVVGTGYRGTGT